jgi:hypothetical protein
MTRELGYGPEEDESTPLANNSDPPPEYEELIQEVNLNQEDFNASARILGKSKETIPLHSQNAVKKLQTTAE